MLFLLPALEGFGLGASLIIAIGAQNAYVLRLGLRRHHVLLAVSFCALSDLALIGAGVFGLGSLVRSLPWFLPVMTWGGAAFLTWYGIQAARRAWNGGHLDVTDEQAPSVPAVLATLAAFTFLNPHVYLDTVLLLGALGARHPGAEQPWFVAGAALASVLWFFGLGFGARLLAPVFQRPVTWRVLDSLIALMMFGLTSTLVVGGLGL